MKRFLILGVVALAIASASVENASAWINSSFGIGTNWSLQCGGNDFLCGLIKCGQPCGPDFYTQHVPVYPRSNCCNGNGAGPVGPMGPGGVAPYGPGPVGAPVQAFRPTYHSYYGYGR